MELELEHIGYRYGDALASEMQALSDISLKITGGEFIGVIGHTGSGKSTLMQIMNALERPGEGRILADGEDIWGEHYDRRSLRSRVGLVFQYPEHQLFETTVIGDVMVGPLNQGLSEKEARARAEHALALTGIDEKWYEQSPFELSGGQKRRTAIAGVLAMEPEILILDEPTAGLDPAGRGEILRQISSLHREYAGRLSILLVSHSMEDVAQYVGRILVMDHGRLVLDDIPQRVFAHVEELESMGLAAPAVTYLLRDLRAAGIEVDDQAYTVEQAMQAILDVWRKRSGDD